MKKFEFQLGVASYDCERITIKFNLGAIKEYRQELVFPPNIPVSLRRLFKYFEECDDKVKYFNEVISQLPYKIIKK